MNIEKYFNIENLEHLYNTKLKDSRAKGIDKLNSDGFKKIKNEQFQIIKKKVLNNQYQFSPFLEVLKLKGRNKNPRVISIPTMRDRLVLLVIKEILHDLFPENVNRKLPNRYIYDIKKFLKNGNENSYFLKLDIENFYDSINRKILLDNLKEKETNPEIINLIDKAINTQTIPSSCNKKDYALYVSEKGIPQGLAISNILAQIYLEKIDKIIDRRRYFYLRYVDDILVLNHDTISDFRYKNIQRALEEIKLSLNKDKKKNGFVQDGFTFLGYKIIGDKISIADKNIELFIKRVAAKFTWFKKGLNDIEYRPNWLKNDDRFIEVFIEELNESITGIVSSNKNYGWLFYFSEINDKSLLFKLDKIISSFFNNIEIFNNTEPKELKKLIRAYHSIKFLKNKKYIANYDNYTTIRTKRDFLVFRGRINPENEYSDAEIEQLFNKYKNKQLKNIEKDIGYKYF